MNFYGGKEMAASFRTVRKNTIQIAEDVPEEKYGFRATPETRTIGQTLAHIAFSTDIQSHLHDPANSDLSKVDFPAIFGKLEAEENKSRTKAEIVAALKLQGDRFAAFLESRPDAFLAESVALPPGATPSSRTRFDMLLSAKEHEMHHRAQLMVLERLVGVVPHLTRQRQEQQARAQAAQAQNT